MRRIMAISIIVFLIGGAGCAPSNSAHNTTSARHTGGLRNTPDFVDLAKKLRPVVVNVSSTRVMRKGAPGQAPVPGNESSEEEWLERFFRERAPSQGRQQNLGSGFIVESDGTILTNYHVVGNAQKIMVRLSDKREFPARIIGSDPKTDIAVLKIDVKETLPVVRFGDSSQLEVGEWVMAVGNPFGLDNTVTSGIVSAKGRHLGAGPYDDFIQTDAPINPGNSGGPLVNGQGEVVGINVAILSQTGASIGIGFATPIDLVKELLPELEAKGKVTRGWAGLTIQEITPDLAEALGLAKPAGALVAGLAKDGPAERGGIRVGDVVTEYDGQEIKAAGDFPIMVARTPVQKKVEVKVLRERSELRLAMTIGELDEPPEPDGAEGEIG